MVPSREGRWHIWVNASLIPDVVEELPLGFVLR
jgi:hypothetical protein